MGDRTALVTRLLAGGAAAVFAASVVGVVAVQPPPPERPISAAAADTSTTSAPDPVPEETTTEAPGAPPSTENAPMTGPTAPRAGTYTYARTSGTGAPSAATTTTSTTRPPRTTTTRRGRTATSSSTTTTAVRAQTGPRGEDTRTVTVSRGGRQGDAEIGQLSVVLLTGAGEVGGTASVAWGLGGLVHRDVTYRLFGGTFACDWQPDWAQFAPSLAPGTTWSSATTCTGTVRGGQLADRPVTIKRRDAHRSTGQQVEQVAGRSITTFSVAGTTDIDFDAGELSFTSRSEGTDRFAPELGLTVGSTTSTAVTSFGVARTTTVTELLVAIP